MKRFKTIIICLVFMVLSLPLYSATSSNETIQFTIQSIHDEFMKGTLRNSVSIAERQGRYDGDDFSATYSNDEITYTFDNFNSIDDICIVSGSFIMDRMGNIETNNLYIRIENVEYSIYLKANLANLKIFDESISKI